MANLPTRDPGGDPDEYDDDDGSSGGGGGGGGGFEAPGFDDIAPDFIANNLARLEAFLRNPRRFIIGAVAATILETVFGIVTGAINLVFLIFGGSNPAALNAPGETLGIADVPVFIADQLADVGSTVGGAIITAIENLNAPLFEAATFAGPLSPAIILVVVSIETIVVLWVLQRLVYVVADLLQLGGLTE